MPIKALPEDPTGGSVPPRIPAGRVIPGLSKPPFTFYFPSFSWHFAVFRKCLQMFADVHILFAIACRCLQTFGFSQMFADFPKMFYQSLKKTANHYFGVEHVSTNILTNVLCWSSTDEKSFPVGTHELVNPCLSSLHGLDVGLS